ncbi:MAG: DNA repair protein RadA [Geminicoccaceae bacterium]|nr:DNA repair protein RadA [Geminicoccaceae bacterium]
MVRQSRVFACQSCGQIHPRWAGRCDGCGEWNTLVEEVVEGPAASAKGRARGKAGGLELVGLHGTEKPAPRLSTGIDELDRALGGGIVPGSAMLLGGDPGIGKSTLTLQAAAALSAGGKRVVYVSGEESVSQIRLRAARLGIGEGEAGRLELAVSSQVEEILGGIRADGMPALLIIDSIQTMQVTDMESAPGSVSQLRAASHRLIQFAKRHSMAVLLIGHVTKDGQIAGPRVLEHMVDTVLYFEGESSLQFRILRAVKNRFGPANEIGVFEMREAGLVPVGNPSALFLGARDEAVAGTVVFAGIEGSRPLLVEIQALVAPSPLATPRRAVVGWDNNRLAMLLAVLEARCGLVMSGRDVYLNVAGGLRVQEPAADLAVAAALVSSLVDRPLAAGTVLFGEIGLAGEVRAVSRRDARLKEAEKLGFSRAITPRRSEEGGRGTVEQVELSRLNGLVELV